MADRQMSGGAGAGWRLSGCALRGLLVLGVLFPLVGMATNRVLEGEYQAAVKESLEVGEVVELSAAGETFAAVYTLEVTPFRRGAVMLLHDRGAHPDFAGVIAHLRRQLTQHGWQTLSLQMPVFRPDVSEWEQQQLVTDAPARFQAGIDYLRQQGITNIAVIGHGLGSRMGLHSLAQGAVPEVSALVMIGLAAPTGIEGDVALQDLQAIQLPVLDLYGSRDSVRVVGTAVKRRAASRKAGQSGYSQLRVEGADHQFSGMLPMLSARVNAWLSRIAESHSNSSVEATGAEGAAEVNQN